MIHLYSWPAPNGHKVQILVEELGIPYRLIPIDITKGEQREPGYLAINPNAKIPALIDDEPLDGDEPVTVFESGAVMLYLAEKTQRFLPAEPRLRIEMLQWLFWQVGGLGPRGSTLHPDFRPFWESAFSAGAGFKSMIAKVLWWHVCNSNRQT